MTANVVLPEKRDHGSMDAVIVPREKLLETLRENRQKHRTIFEEALEGYQARAIELLEEHIARIRTGSVEQVFVSLPRPEDHTDDYDRAIQMLEWTLTDEVSLTVREFDMYVRDSWQWRREFLTANAVYSNTAAESLR